MFFLIPPFFFTCKVFVCLFFCKLNIFEEQTHSCHVNHVGLTLNWIQIEEQLADRCCACSYLRPANLSAEFTALLNVGAALRIVLQAQQGADRRLPSGICWAQQHQPQFCGNIHGKNCHEKRTLSPLRTCGRLLRVTFNA